MAYKAPFYSLDKVACFVENKCISTTKKVLLALDNHGWIFEDLMPLVLKEIINNRCVFCKTVELHGSPGMFADVYKVDCEDECWYVKFYIEDGIIVLSCKPYGSNWP